MINVVITPVARAAYISQKDNSPQSSDTTFYSSPQGDVKIEVIFKDEKFWLTQKRMSELFGEEVALSLITRKRFIKAMNCRKMQLLEKFG